MDTSLYILEDNDQFSKIIQTMLPSFSKKPFFITSNVNDFMEAVKEPAILILDFNLNTFVDGVDVFIKIKERQKICFPIYMTSLATKEVYEKIIGTGWGSFLVRKDVTDFFPQLAAKIEQAEITLNEKYRATLRLDEMDRSMKLKTQKLLNILDSYDTNNTTGSI